ncbi:MAG: metalloregulator ArsR/SmtB family transcription factor [Solirubrobacterales bacterium]
MADLSASAGAAGGASRDAAVGAVFAALADPTRRHLIEALAAGPGATATGLASALPISRQAVAKHLATLDEAGLVSRRRHGRETQFELEARPLAEAAAWIAAVGADWDNRLGRLRRTLER